MDNDRKKTNDTGMYESPHKDEYDKMVEQIKAKRKAMSRSIWTDEPLIKPYKSIWIDDEQDLQSPEPESEPQIEPITSESAQEDKPDPSNAHTPPYYEPNPFIRDARNEKLAFGVTPEHYDEVIMPFVNEYSVERKLPDQRKHLSRKPKANAAVSYASQKQTQSAEKREPLQHTPTEPTEPVSVHKLRHERFFDDEGEPLSRHSPQRSSRKRPKIVPLSQRTDRSQDTQKRVETNDIQTQIKLPTVMPEAYTVETGPKFGENEQSRPNDILKPMGEQFGTEPETSENKAVVDMDMHSVNVLVCLGALFIIAIALLIMTVLGKREKTSESEKRELARFPSFSLSSLLSGDFTNGVTEYFTDTIPGRESFKRFNSAFTNCFGFSIGDVRINGTLKKVTKEKYDENAQAKPAVTVNTNPGGAAQEIPGNAQSNADKEEIVEIPDNLDEGKMLGNVVVTGKGAKTRGLNCFYGTFELGKNFSETVNKWKSDLGEGVNVYAMPIPLASAYYMPKSLKDQVSDQNENIKNIIGCLDGVVGINCFNTLAKHMNEYIYARTDHHWMPLGAYYATKDFADAAGVEYPDLEQYDKFTIDGFVGTLYAYSNYDQQLNNNPDTFDYFKPKNIGEITSTYYTTDFASTYEPITDDPSGIFYDYASGASCYSAFLNRDDEIVEINTPCKNGRTLVIFKDSFGNAMVPFLLNSFSKIYVCDFRYFNINAIDFCRKVGCTDLLFAMSVSSCCTTVQVDCIKNLRLQ